MFEKEAEEKITEQYGTSGEYVTRQRIWQKGAKFGYNKANEWHYVKDGNPDNENDILCQISKDEVVVGYYHTIARQYYTIYGQVIDNVIAWKEIVLPKEIE